MGVCICGQCEWFNPLEDEVIEVIELENSFDSNLEVEINVEESEALEVESLGFVLPDSLGYNPTSPKGVAKSPLYSLTSLDYFLSDSLYSLSTGPISFDYDLLEIEKIIEAVEVVARESATKIVEPATPAPKPRRHSIKRRIHYPQKFPTKFF